MQAQKQCSKCRQVKPLTDFHRNCATVDKRHTSCKSCRCLQAAAATDLGYKRELAKRQYAMKRCQFKAKRVLLHVLQDVEWNLLMQQPKTNEPCRPAKWLVETFVPDAAVAHVANLLQSHLGPDAYWTGYGTAWSLGLKETPLHRIWAEGDGLVETVREMLQPKNIEFQRMPPEPKISFALHA